jgi:hypothetical protein
MMSEFYRFCRTPWPKHDKLSSNVQRAHVIRHTTLFVDVAPRARCVIVQVRARRGMK